MGLERPQECQRPGFPPRQCGLPGKSPHAGCQQRGALAVGEQVLARARMRRVDAPLGRTNEVEELVNLLVPSMLRLELRNGLVEAQLGTEESCPNVSSRLAFRGSRRPMPSEANSRRRSTPGLCPESNISPSTLNS